MKILMLGWELPPHNSGGLGVACYQLCQALSRRDVDIEFIVPYTADHGIDFMTVKAAYPNGVVDVIKDGGAYDSYRYVYSNGVQQSVDIFGQQAAYENAVAETVDLVKFDVIHAHDWLTFRAALRVKEQTGKPLILHVHSLERDRAGGHHGNPLVREIEYTALMIADRIVTVSEHTKRSIVEDYSIPSTKIEVVHNSINSGSLHQLDDTNAYTYLSQLRQAGYKVIVSVGRLTIQKGLPNLLQSLKRVVEYQPKTICLIVGNGEQEEELIGLAAELGIGQNVLFAGFQRGKKWRDAYAIGDLFVMPSISEPFGITALEASGYGIPVLLSRQSGVAEVLKNCLKVDFWDTEEMANQMISLLRDSSLAAALQSNATREYEQLSWSPAADKLVEIYNRHMKPVLGVSI